MKKTNKKHWGFTLVELVIVIAVIAILAAVLIPTFSSLIRRANVSKDQQLIRNLNTALIADKALNGNHKTMTAALATAKAAGYDVAQINKNATDNEILWDSQNDLFCYYNDETSAIEYLPEQKLTVTTLTDVDYFQIIDIKADEADDEGVADMTDDDIQYSIYLRDVADAVNTVKHNKGIDVGKNTVSVNYTNTTAQNVIICTNSASTALKIEDSSEGTIYHYGEAGTLNIVQCHTSSYHENGKVAFAEIAKGRIVLESGASVTRIHLNATAGNFTDITVAKDESVKMPEFSRDSVAITAEGKLVVALQNGTAQDANKEYIWLTAVGIYEQVTVSTSANNAGNTYAAETGSDEQKTAAQQIANNITATVGDDTYTVTATKNGDNWEYSLIDENNAPVDGYDVDEDEGTITVTETGSGNPVDTTVENGLNEEQKEDAKTGATVFAGGTGTKNDPFLIYDYETMQKISDFFDKGYYYFAVAIEKTDNGTIDCSNWIPVKLRGSFDGSNVVFKNLDDNLFVAVYHRSNGAYIKNFDVSDCFISTTGVAGIIGQLNSTCESIIENIHITGYVEGQQAGGLMYYYNGNQCAPKLTFNNCSSSAVLVSTGGQSCGFIGNTYYGANPTHIYLNNSYFDGSLSATGANNYFSIDNSQYQWHLDADSLASAHVTFKTNAKVTPTLGADGVNKVGQYKWADDVNGGIVCCCCLEWSDLALYESRSKLTVNTSTTEYAIGDKLSVTAKSGSSRAVAILTISPNDQNDTGSYTAQYMSEELELVDGQFTTNVMEMCNICINDCNDTNSKSHYDSETHTYHVHNSFYGHTHNGSYIMIVEYNSVGAVTQITKIAVESATN